MPNYKPYWKSAEPDFLRYSMDFAELAYFQSESKAGPDCSNSAILPLPNLGRIRCPMSDANVTIELVEEYLALTEEARSKATPIANGESDEERLSSMLRMCDDYASDARHFMQEGDLVRAFGAINYSHAWLDAAVRIGLLDGHGDDRLFTLP